MAETRTPQAQLESQANETVEQVKEMCRRAYSAGRREGYECGFRDGVIAMGPPRQQTPANDA